MDPDSGRFPGNKGPDVTVKTHQSESIQDEVDNATDTDDPDGYLIVGVVAKDSGLLGGTAGRRWTSPRPTTSRSP